MPKRSEQAKATLQAFRGERAKLATALKALAENKDYSADYKSRQAIKLRNESANALFRDVQSMWRGVLRHVAEARGELAAIRTKQDDRWDYTRIDVESREMAGKLARLGGASGPLGGGALQAAMKLAKQYEADGDIHRLRALGIATQPIMEKVGIKDTEGRAYSGALNAILGKLDAEPPEVKELKADLRELASVAKDVVYEIRAAESEATNRPDLLQDGTFGAAASTWEPAILGEDPPAVPGLQSSPRTPQDSAAQKIEAPTPKATDEVIVASLRGHQSNGAFGQPAMVEA